MRSGGVAVSELIMGVWEWSRCFGCVLVWENDSSDRVGVYVVCCFELPGIN